MEVQYCLCGGFRIAYRRQGQGEPVLLLHGVGSYSFVWREVMNQLAPDYDLIATDLLGCGDSEKPADGDYSIAEQAELLVEFIDQLDCAPVHLVGRDVGGGIAQILAVKYPHLFRDLTLINPVGYDYWPVQPITTMRLPVIRGVTASFLNPAVMRIIIRRGLYYKERLTPELMDEFWRPLATAEGKAGFTHLIHSLNNRHLTEIADDLCRLELPTLIIRGDADAYLSKEISIRLARDIPNARLERVAHGGHFIQIDEPQRLSSLMADFMKKGA